MKVVLAGETFEFDDSKRAMSEALAIEGLYKHKYIQWQQDLAVGELEAWCMYAWLVWRRDGRNVDYDDIKSGEVDFDLEEFAGSIVAGRKKDEPESEPDPTEPSATGG